MSQQEGIVKGDALQKSGSAGFLIGAILMVIGVTWPASVDIGGAAVMQQEFGQHAVLLQVCALLMTFGFWGVMIGMAGIYRSITANTASGDAWARLGFYFLLVGTAIWTIGSSLNVSYPAAIVNWQAASADGKDAAYIAVAAIPGFGRGLFPLEVIINWLAFALLGIGMVQSGVVPRWLGWFGLTLGMVGILLGITQTFTGRESSLILFGVLLYVTILWWLVTGIWVARRAW
ncbi:MAG: hypothetical protein MUO23_13325 [Anaerolineales bacterium]|nr:hypothetical protein [Anaerolineales bacterium]